MRLNLGCGQNPKRDSMVNLDIRPGPNVDVVHDCETFPWPFPDETFDAIIAWHVFEHLKPWLMIDIMDECWRVLKPDGLLKIGMPAEGSFGLSQEPTHIRTWNEATPHHFDPNYGYYKVYRPKPWKILVNEKFLKTVPHGLVYTDPKTYNASIRIIMRKRP